MPNANRRHSGPAHGDTAPRANANSPDFVTAAATVGAVAIGVVLFEAALVPGVLIGGAAMLAPRFFPLLRRRVELLFAARASRPVEPAPLPRGLPVPALPTIPARFAIRQAVAKTITFRIIVTALDFTSNYVVLGEVATAAGLSAFALVVGPLFYLGHEAAWNYYGPSGATVTLPALLPLRSGAEAPGDRRGITISLALAKTITFRTVATAMDFTTLYVVVGDLATAAGLSAFGFVVGPFVYLGHEMLWDRFGSPGARPVGPPTLKLLPAPARSA